MTVAEPLQVWCASAGVPRFTARAAQRAEAEGFDGFVAQQARQLFDMTRR